MSDEDFDFDDDDLETALDRHPCPDCGQHYNNHVNLNQAEVWDARDQGCTVEVCETRRRWSYVDDSGDAIEEEVYWCVVITPPDEPCNVDFMKEISS